MANKVSGGKKKFGQIVVTQCNVTEMAHMSPPKNVFSEPSEFPLRGGEEGVAG